ncbi:MAG TPA: OstA-like protein [Ferruginibacter sp.]|nr:OstA-like protein [Ferruginibacter sp.]
MKASFYYRIFSLLLLLIGCNLFAAAQQKIVQPPPAHDSDSVRIIQIVQGNSLRSKTTDSTTIETIAGNVILKEGGVTFICDSAIINRLTNSMEAFGNVHINQGDSINTYSQHLLYTANDRIAHLDKYVKITDKKGTLLTQKLDYDLKTNIGNYYNGGTVINGKTTLTSTEGTYYGDTKDVYFKKNVHLVDPKYNIVTDSLLYNTDADVVTFITGTYIKSQTSGNVYTTQGTYDLKNGKAFFGNRSVIQDTTGATYTADNMAFEEKTGIAELEGNAVIKDTINHFTLVANQIFSNKKTNSFLATKKPVLIFVGQKHDSTFIAADTLYSGIVKPEPLIGEDNTPKGDSARQKRRLDFFSDTTLSYVNTKRKIVKDSSVDEDSVVQKINRDSLVATTPIDSSKKLDSSKKNNRHRIFPQRAFTAIQVDTLKRTTIVTSADKNAPIRFFQAFHHVRIFNDSVQCVSDSLYYSAEDSIFRLFEQPVIFSHNSQITGDTIFLYTKNRTIDRMYVFYNGLIINKTPEGFANQIGGRTINGYFKDGAFNYMRVRGTPAQSIFYPRSDSDSSYSGMNRCKGDVIDIYFIDNKLNKVKFINDVDGTMYPMFQIPEDQKFLKGYKWLDARRPRTKFELYE